MGKNGLHIRFQQEKKLSDLWTLLISIWKSFKITGQCNPHYKKTDPHTYEVLPVLTKRTKNSILSALEEMSELHALTLLDQNF